MNDRNRLEASRHKVQNTRFQPYRPLKLHFHHYEKKRRKKTVGPLETPEFNVCYLLTTREHSENFNSITSNINIGINFSSESIFYFLIIVLVDDYDLLLTKV